MLSRKDPVPPMCGRFWAWPRNSLPKLCTRLGILGKLISVASTGIFLFFMPPHLNWHLAINSTGLGTDNLQFLVKSAHLAIPLSHCVGPIARCEPPPPPIFAVPNRKCKCPVRQEKTKYSRGARSQLSGFIYFTFHSLFSHIISSLC